MRAKQARSGRSSKLVIVVLTFFGVTGAVAVFVALGNDQWSSRGECVIFVAAEPSESDFNAANVSAVTRCLTSGLTDTFSDAQRTRLRRAALRVEEDQRVFPSAVNVDIGGLASVLRASSSAQRSLQPLYGCVFSNRLALKSSYRQFEAWSGGFTEERAFKWLVPEHRIRKDNPFSSPAVLKACLQEVASVHKPAIVDYVLIVKGHGEAKQFMCPMVTIDATDESHNCDETRKKALAHQDSPESIEPKMIGDETAGISREEFLNVLKSAGADLGMRFKAVYVEACHTKYEESDRPACVEQLCFRRRASTPYVSVIYSDLGASVQNRESFSSALVRELIERDCTVLRRNHGFGSYILVAGLVILVPLLWWGLPAKQTD